MEIKKIVISPSNTKAIEFLNRIINTKAEIVERIEKMPNLFHRKIVKP